MSDEGRLDEDVCRNDPDRWLASRFIADPLARADVLAVYAFDIELARAERVASSPIVAEFRLAWWREVLDEAFGREAVRAHPLARTLAEVIRRRSLDRDRLETMIDAHSRWLGRPRLELAEALDWAGSVAGQGAMLAAGILDPKSPVEPAAPAGRIWGLWLLGRQGRAPADEVARRIRTDLPAATREAARLSPAAFPAVAHAALARAGGRPPGPLAARLRLLRAVVTGRI